MSKSNRTGSFDSLLRQGSQLLHKGHAFEAMPLLEEAHQLDPDDPRTALNLSSAYILDGKFKRAVPVLEILSEQTPDNPMVWTNLGAAYLGNPVLAREKEQQKAIVAFKRALTIDPVAPSVAYNLGLIYRDQKEFKEAVFWFKEAVKANPRDKDARILAKRLAEKLLMNEEDQD
jgi:tetratricopeptide (TPR) repeat protein